MRPALSKPAQATAVSDFDPTVPTLTLDPPPPWSWPLPPGVARRFAAPLVLASAQPCQIETQSGLTLQGTMLGFDATKRRLQFRAAGGGIDASLPFSGVRRLTLGAALRPAPGRASASSGRAPPVAQERDYRLQQVGNDPTAALTGRTAGHVQAAEGLYLFSPTEPDGALCCVFVPRSAYSRCEFGPSVEELAARHWIASPAKLVEALEQQQRAPVLPLGPALLALGLLSPTQLDRMQQQLDGKTALGDALVDSGRLSRTDLQTALAHTMGFPLVDLERFPRNPQALALLPRHLAISHRVLPLMLDKQRLIVAVDRPGRVLKLRQLPDYAQLPMVPVLALKSQILAALNAPSDDAASFGVEDDSAFSPLPTEPSP